MPVVDERVAYDWKNVKYMETKTKTVVILIVLYTLS